MPRNSFFDCATAGEGGTRIGTEGEGVFALGRFSGMGFASPVEFPSAITFLSLTTFF